MEDNNQNTKSSEDIEYELEVSGNGENYTPDEEEFPENNDEKETENEDEEETENEDVGEDLNRSNIGLHGSGINANQEKTDEKTYKENVDQVLEKQYKQGNETYDKNVLTEDSKLNPQTETQFQAPDPDEPKKIVQNSNSSKKKMKNKNQPL